MTDKIKIRMLSRFSGEIGKMEKGFIYEVDPVYARELIKTGLAELVIEKIIIERPVHITAKEIGQSRTKAGRFMPKAKVK